MDTRRCDCFMEDTFLLLILFVVEKLKEVVWGSLLTWDADWETCLCVYILECVVMVCMVYYYLLWRNERMWFKVLFVNVGGWLGDTTVRLCSWVYVCMVYSDLVRRNERRWFEVLFVNMGGWETWRCVCILESVFVGCVMICCGKANGGLRFFLSTSEGG